MLREMELSLNRNICCWTPVRILNLLSIGIHVVQAVYMALLIFQLDLTCAPEALRNVSSWFFPAVSILWTAVAVIMTCVAAYGEVNENPRILTIWATYNFAVWISFGLCRWFILTPSCKLPDVLNWSLEDHYHVAMAVWTLFAINCVFAVTRVGLLKEARKGRAGLYRCTNDDEDCGL